MTEQDWLAERFEADRDHLGILGSLIDADDAVQEAWLRLSRSDTSRVENLTGWLTTVVGRVCLDMLRSRKARREEPLQTRDAEANAERQSAADPGKETVLADSVGLALLVVLEELSPAERLAFVLHDMFDLPFADIAPIVDRSPAAARQLASRARRRVRGRRPDDVPEPDIEQQRTIVDAYLAAARCGDFEALLGVLDPDVLAHVDPELVPAGVPTEIRGAEEVANAAISAGARDARPALVNGAVGAVVAPGGRLHLVLEFTILGGRILRIGAIAGAERLAALELRALET